MPAAARAPPVSASCTEPPEPGLPAAAGQPRPRNGDTPEAGPGAAQPACSQRPGEAERGSPAAHLPRRLQSVKYVSEMNFSTRSSAVRLCLGAAMLQPRCALRMRARRAHRRVRRMPGAEVRSPAAPLPSRSGATARGLGATFGGALGCPRVRGPRPAFKERPHPEAALITLTASGEK